MKRILMLAFAAALSMGVSACQDTTSPGAALSGTYTLRSINGYAPPATIDADPVNGTTEVVGGYIQIDRSGNYTDVVTYRETPPGGGPVTYDDTINGTWALSGNELEFTDVTNPGEPYYATVSGNQLVFQNYASGASYTVVYQK